MKFTNIIQPTSSILFSPYLTGNVYTFQVLTAVDNSVNFSSNPCKQMLKLQIFTAENKDHAKQRCLICDQTCSSLYNVVYFKCKWKCDRETGVE